MRSWSWPLAALALIAIMVACESSGPADPTIAYQRLVLAQNAIDVGVDEQQQLTLASRPLGGSVSWQSTNPSVATVSSSGVVSGRAIGTAQIVAAYARSRDTATVTVHAAIAKLAVNPDSATVLVGQSMQLSFGAYDKTGKLITGVSGSSAKWSSSDSTVATVSASGLVKGSAAGSASITLSISGKTVVAYLRVSRVPVDTVVVAPSPSAAVNVGGSLRFTATAQDSTGKPLSDWIVVWSSSDSSVATVSSTGAVSSYKVGSATITASAGGKRAQTTLITNPAVVASVIIAVNASTIQIGQSTQAVAMALDSAGNQITGRAVSWASAKPSIASVSSLGVITGVDTGTAKISASVDGVTGSTTETVGGATIANLSVVLDKSTIPVGATAQATAVATDASGNVLTGRTVTWNSSNTSIATVSNLGVVTAVGTGTVSISGAVDGKTASATLVATTSTVASIIVTAPVTSLGIGQTTQATAQLLDASGTTVTAPVTWTTSASAVATVSSTGVVSAVASGSATITATSGTASGTLPISVTTSTATPTTSIAAAPELPRVYLNTTYPTSVGSIRSVPAGGDLQAALNAALPGDQIVLAAGAVYSGNFVLPTKSGCASYIVIRSGGLDSDYPAPGTRMSPTYAPKLAKIITPNTGTAIAAASGSCKWWLSRVEISATAQSSTVNYNYGLVRLGNGESTLGALPSDIVFDRVYIHGGGSISSQNGLLFNGAAAAIVDSYVSDIHWPGVETHAIAGWAGTGPYKIVNNYLEAASINVLFGGADPVIANVTPSDIEVRGNYFFKPLSYKGVGYAVKNLMELKNAKRLLIEGNVFENSWGDAQIGWGLIMQSVTDHPEVAPWTQTADVTMRYNIVKNVWGGIDLTSNGWNGSGIPMTRVAIENNLMLNVGGGGTSTGVQLLNSLTDVSVRHNTVIRNTEQYGAPFMLDGSGAARIDVRDNVAGSASPYGMVFKSGGAMGTAAFTQWAGSSWQFVGNAGWSLPSDPSVYPAGNYWASSQSAVGFAADWSLTSGSPFKGKATDGTDPGANVTQLQAVANRVPTGRGRLLIP